MMTSSTWFCFSESLDASFWIFTTLFSSRLFLLWIFSNLSSCDFFSSFNFSIYFSSSWVRFFRSWFSSWFSRILPSRSSLDYSFLRLCFSFLIFVINIFLWFCSQRSSSLLLDNTLLIFVISNLCVFLMSSYCCWIFSFVDVDITWILDFVSFSGHAPTHYLFPWWVCLKDLFVLLILHIVHQLIVRF